MGLSARLVRELKRLGVEAGRAVVAVSGGPDSLVLFDLLRRTREEMGLDLVLAHADHGIHPDSGQVADQVATLGTVAEIPVRIGRLELGPGCGETRARRARYGWLEEIRQQERARWILTAHHRDDQVETVLLRVLAGSGPAGLAAMAPVTGCLVRPLLWCSRARLRRYATLHRLTGWEDPANLEEKHLRNWVRLTVLPALRDRVPDVDRRLVRVARQAALERKAWEELLGHSPGLVAESAGGAVEFDLAEVRALPPALAATLVRTGIRRAGHSVGARRVSHALSALKHAGSGATADLGSGWRLELAFDRLRVVAPAGTEPSPLALTADSGESTWGDWRVLWQREPAPGQQDRDGLTAWFIPDQLVVRTWQAGDRLRPLGGTGHRLAVRCFQDRRVPRSERGRWPVVEGPDEVLWIPGVCRSDQRVPGSGEPSVRVDVSRR